MGRTAKKPAPLKNQPSKGRVSPKMKAVIEHMAETGVSLKCAAEHCGMGPDAARTAFNRPVVRRAFNQLVKEVRDNAAQQAYLGIVEQSQKATNERLRFDAKRWVAGVDGISPVQKVHGQHSHSHSFTGFTYPDLEPKDVTPVDAQSDAQGDE